MKPIKVHNDEILKAVTSGESYIEIGNRKFLLFEVEKIEESDRYEVTDEGEKKQLLEALHGENPLLTDTEINKMLDAAKNV